MPNETTEADAIRRERWAEHQVALLGLRPSDALYDEAMKLARAGVTTRGLAERFLVSHPYRSEDHV